jgi:hypothetical protein
MGLLSYLSCLPCGCESPVADRPLPHVTPVPTHDVLILPHHIRALPSAVRDAYPKLRVVCLSDVHARHADVSMPPGDVVIFAGDVTRHRSSSADLESFLTWARTLPYRHKLAVAGNHEVCLDPSDAASSAARYAAGGVSYMQDQAIAIPAMMPPDSAADSAPPPTVSFYGSPWRPARGCCYRAEAFGAAPSTLAEARARIPSEPPICPDVLITHHPVCFHTPGICLVWFF